MGGGVVNGRRSCEWVEGSLMGGGVVNGRRGREWVEGS